MGKLLLKTVIRAGMCLLLGVLAPPAARADSTGDTPPQFAERLHRPGLHMLGRVHDGLYRGANPDGEDGYAALRELGIKTVISLRSDDNNQDLPAQFGMKKISIPMFPEHPPTLVQQREFLALVTDTNLWPIFVHCARGRDRTGVMMALYRVRVAGWSKDDAIAEMKYFGHSHREYPTLEEFIRALPEDSAAESAMAAPQSCGIEFVGHRGYSARYPENTLLSIEEAFRRGVKYCEIDVTVTRDDVYVLFHDQPTMYRTSSGRSYIRSRRYADLQDLDFGAWKGAEFSGTPATTLRDAMLLAEKYNAHLYLDTKVFRADLLGKLLDETGVNPNRILPSMYTLEEASEFRKYCPNSSWVWFGGLPDDPGDDDWYAERIALGCTIFEFYYSKALDNSDTYQIFRTKVHEAGAKIWVFTVNTVAEALALAEVGVDGMETDNAVSLIKYFREICAGETSAVQAERHHVSAEDHLTTANYLFEQADLFSTGIGSQLRPLAYSDTELLQNVSFGSTAQFGIPPINGTIVTVMKVPAFNPRNGLMLFPNFLPHQEEDLQYEYTLVLDLYIPSAADSKIASVYQTDPANTNDGDLFIDMNRGLGINNEYHGAFVPDTWYRIAVAVSRNTIRKYINGKFAGENQISAGRWAIYNTFPGGQNQGFLLFADEDSETFELYVHAVQVRNYAMSGDEVARLGTVAVRGIPLNNTGIYYVRVSGETGTGSIVNWDDKTITTTFPENFDSANVAVYFKTSYGASASLRPGSVVDLRAAAKEIVITAEDGITQTRWQLLDGRQLR